MDASSGTVVKRNRLTDIELILKPRPEGPRASSKQGLVDHRLFTGGNRLHAIMDTKTCLWYLKYDDGAVPRPLAQRFTGFTPLINFVKDYFDKRNIDIVEIKD